MACWNGVGPAEGKTGSPPSRVLGPRPSPTWCSPSTGEVGGSLGSARMKLNARTAGFSQPHLLPPPTLPDPVLGLRETG